MRMSWVGRSAGIVAALALLGAFSASTPLHAGEAAGSAGQAAGSNVMAAQLDQRTKPPAKPQGGLNDTLVRNIMSWTWATLDESLTRDEAKQEAGGKASPNAQSAAKETASEGGSAALAAARAKRDPKPYLISIDDARQVIMAAARSAHAKDCDLKDLAQKNYVTLMEREQASHRWTPQQMQYINALHIFTLGLMTGQIAVDGKPVQFKANVKPSTCSPEKKKAVTEEITAFINSPAPVPAPGPGPGPGPAPAPAPGSAVGPIQPMGPGLMLGAGAAAASGPHVMGVGAGPNMIDRSSSPQAPVATPVAPEQAGAN